ncbi:MAG TPA: hypothetical protein VLC07_01780 [Solirubrobacterales bacterium]|nr:hypothetical protein [Solirubrobacterales bacterium]
MSVVRRRSKFLVLLVAVAGLALVLSACAFFKENSLSVSQPGGIGSTRVHFVLCTEPGLEGKPACNEDKTEGEVQFLLGIAVTPGSSAPSTITASPTEGGAPITFTRNDQVAKEIESSTAALHASKPEEIGTWPPPGLEGVGYLSSVVVETKGPTIEWSVDADFGLPNSTSGSPFVGPFRASPALGLRAVAPEAPADRPPKCLSSDESAEPTDAICFPSEEEAQVGTSDLKIAAPATASVFVGGNASLQFAMNLGSTAGAVPTFNVTGGTSLSGATATVSAPTFTPPAPDASTHLSSGSETVSVAVPSTAVPGVYDVTITAKTPQGGTATQVAKLEVTKPGLKVGKVKLNKRNGTAKLSVGVPSAGTLTASGKGIVKAQRTAAGPTTLKLTIKAKGKAKKKLAATGKAKVKVKLVFKPENGAPVTKTKSIVLKKKLT